MQTGQQQNHLILSVVICLPPPPNKEIKRTKNKNFNDWKYLQPHLDKKN